MHMINSIFLKVSLFCGVQLLIYFFPLGYKLVTNFSNLDLSAFYFELIKRRLYTESPKSVARRSSQTVLSFVCSNSMHNSANITLGFRSATKKSCAPSTSYSRRCVPPLERQTIRTRLRILHWMV